jgi:phenylalanyl-tRNA synthetase beta chain
MLTQLGLADATSFVEAKPAPAWASVAAQILDADNNTIGAYGPASPQTIKAFDLQTPVILGEIAYNPLTSAFPPITQVEPLPKFPSIERDLSAVVDESIQWSAIHALINDINPPLMTGVDFVTAYRGKQVTKGQKSLTFRMTFRDPERTLQHDEVSEQVQTIIDRLSGELKAEIRS